MNDDDKNMAGIALIAAIGAALFPPWQVISPSGMTVSRGYAFLFDPPGAVASIDIVRLGVEEFIIAAIAVILVFIWRPWKT